MKENIERKRKGNQYFLLCFQSPCDNWIFFVYVCRESESYLQSMRAKLISFCFFHFPIVTKPKKKELERNVTAPNETQFHCCYLSARRLGLKLDFSRSFFPPLHVKHTASVWMKELNDHVHNIDAFENHRDGMEKKEVNSE